MPGSPPPFENRAVTREGSPCMWAAVVRPPASADGVNVPVSSEPLACAARWPAWTPEIALIASTASSASESICADHIRQSGGRPAGRRPCCLPRATGRPHSAGPRRGARLNRNVCYELARLCKRAHDSLVEALAHGRLGALGAR